MVVRITLLILIAMWHPLAAAASFSASVDKHQLSLEEHLTLTLSLRNSDTRLRAEGVDPNIDLSSLSRHFALGTPVPNHNFNIYQGRGRSNSTITVDLFPKKTGSYTIPDFSVDGLTTQPISIRVNRPAGDAPELFVRAGANLSHLWQNQQLVVYLDIYHRVTLKQASLGDNLETSPYLVDLIPHWKLPQSDRQERYKGFDYDVMRLAWALFPDRSGDLTVHLPDVWVETQSGRKQRLLHQELKFQIRALPEGVPQDIIIGRPQLSHNRANLVTRQGELINWEVTLEAPVAVAALPGQLLLKKAPEGLKYYLDAPRRDSDLQTRGMTDIAVYDLAIMPMAAGQYQLPDIELPYFDPERGKVESVTMSGPGLIVNPATTASPTPREPAQTGPEDLPPEGIRLNLWQMTTGIFALLWLITLGMWLKGRSAPAIETAPSLRPKPLSQTTVLRPMEQKLLNALGCRTLEEGITLWQRHCPDATGVVELLKEVQRYYYAPQTTAAREQQLSKEVDAIVRQIKAQQPVTQNSNKDLWSPASFTPSPKIRG